MFPPLHQGYFWKIKEIVKMEELKKIIVELNSVFEELIPIEKIS